MGRTEAARATSTKPVDNSLRAGIDSHCIAAPVDPRGIWAGVGVVGPRARPPFDRQRSAMPRIRTIKPEFPQSESVGRLSRDARLLFILLWTLADDEGRGRAAPALLKGLLYPYDDDALGLIEGWLSELERGGSIRRYDVGSTRYFDIPGWSVHQKIAHPGKSRLPANPKDQGKVVRLREN